ncbi:Bug family tripartite tricarboxylate transporter substrate binding protein [Ramlibacter rhizophilus]|uniref:Tripartite tricarboxylate transporter substrate binding protein n=1 Tax=Ramlibacter rhizophilus TaxID=1781167 RepID=A0A4Z0BP29_9BURK|nr:tripartite tricarboxylate transporter substrate binding protein [Ramlibacter rhizophilus]TFY99804.1 tripartite tricarboxylate transporter substrate binding protein [Ramlibacter rhizophilus]
MIRSTRRLALATVASALAFALLPATAQSGDPLRVILPVGAGSGVDTIVRAAQNALGKELNRPVVIENLPGAGGITGTSQIVKAAPDGRTIGIVSNNHAVNPSVFKNMPYDSLADITPITVIGQTPFVLVVNPQKLPVNNAKELQAALKAKPGHYNFASSGNGTILHLAAEMYNDAANVQARHIPYKGVGPMINDLLSGQVDYAVLAVPAVQGHLKAGTLRAVGITGDQRVPSMPELPTVQEQGFPTVDVGGWFAAVGPKGMAPAEVQRLQAAIARAWATPEVQQAMAKQTNIINPSTPQAAAEFMRAEQARYAKLVASAGVKLD